MFAAPEPWRYAFLGGLFCMSVNYKIRPPRSGSMLYRSIFENNDESTTIKLISDGLVCVVDNASRLLDDVELLVAKDKYASARFLLATADEEMAKSYILLDMCRLNFEKHSSVLRSLCKAFYDHVLKHAYNAIHRFNRVQDLNDARKIWKIEITKWWPNNDPKSGEPDMPHDTYFSREMPLYVDYINYDRQWSVPSNEREAAHFEKNSAMNFLVISKKHLGILKSSYTNGFYDSQILSIFHNEFRTQYVGEGFEKDALLRIYDKIDAAIGKRFPKKTGTLFDTNLCSWPIYHFLTW